MKILQHGFVLFLLLFCNSLRALFQTRSAESASPVGMAFMQPITSAMTNALNIGTDRIQFYKRARIFFFHHHM